MDDERFTVQEPVAPLLGQPAGRGVPRAAIFVGSLVVVAVIAIGVAVVVDQAGGRLDGASPNPGPSAASAGVVDPFGTRAWSEVGDRSRIVAAGPQEPLPPFETSGRVDLSFVALGGDGDLFRVDLGRRVVVRRNDPVMSATQAVVLAAGDDVVTGVHESPDQQSGAAGFVLVGDRLSPVIDVDFPVYRGPDGAHVWRVARIDTDTRVAELIDIGSGEVEQTLDLGFWPVRSEDGDGGLVIDVNGARFAVDADGQTRLPDGTPLGFGPTAFYTRECSSADAIDCVVTRTDRSTGDADIVDAEVLLTASNEFGPRQPGSTAVSPDGDVLFVRRSETGLSWAMVDTASGVVVEAPGPAVGDPIIWSDDSRFALFLSGRQLRLYDRSDASIEVVPGLDDIVAIASQPAAP
jgi:hypothetical protein